MSSSEQGQIRNFEITCRLFNNVGQNVLDRNYRPNWRTVYTGTVVSIIVTEVLYLLWAARSDLMDFLTIVPTIFLACIGTQDVLKCAIKSGEILALRTKLVEIQDVLDETKSNDPIIGKVLQVSQAIQKFVYMLYMTLAITVVFAPFLVWLVLGKKVILFLFFIPGLDTSTDAGFLLNLFFHAFLMLGAYCVLTGHECMFIALNMSVGAYANAFGNEIQELNSMLNLPERNDTEIQDKLKRIEYLHQLLIEYEAMLEDLYKYLNLVKIGFLYLGIISSIVVILKTADPLACLYIALLFEQLTAYCLMGTIITVKNEQLLDHIYDINWYRLSKDQAKQVAFMLHMAQNPTSVTIGKLAPLNVETYMSLLKSIYSYVMVLITFLK